MIIDLTPSSFVLFVNNNELRYTIKNKIIFVISVLSVLDVIENSEYRRLVISLIKSQTEPSSTAIITGIT